MSNIRDFFSSGTSSGDIESIFASAPFLEISGNDLRTRYSTSVVFDSKNDVEFFSYGLTAYTTTSSDNTYTTVCDISGSGALTNVVSCVPTSIGDTSKIRVTVDGVEYEYVFTHTSSISRFVLGHCYPGQLPIDTGYGMGAAYSTEASGSYNYASLTADHIISIPEYVVGNGHFYIPFKTSLKVEVLISDRNTAEADEYCGANYILRT
jgi:hypothetical protein